MNVEILDPRTDREPADWPDFQRHQRLHPVWDFRLMGIEAAAARHPTLLAVARLDSTIVAAFAFTMGRRAVLRWLEVHQPWVGGLPGWTFAESLDPLARKEIVRAFERAAIRYAGPGCAGLLYRYVPREHEPLLAGRGRIILAVTGIAVLDNTFSTVDGWIAALTPNRRSSLRRQLRTIAADPDLVVRFAPAREDLAGPELATLLSGHRARFGKQRYDSRGTVAPEYLHALVHRPDVYTLSYRDSANRLLAFATLLDHAAEPVSQHWAALSRAEGGRAHLFFDSTARLVGHLVEHNRKSLSDGRAMLELKASLGFTVRPLRVVLVPRVVAG